MSTHTTSNGGIGLGGVLFVVFLVMKLMEIDPVASWSWWWVTAPLWIPALIVISFIAVMAALFAWVEGR